VVITLRPLFGFDLVGKSGSLGLMLRKEPSAEGSPGGVLLGGHLIAVDLGFHIRVRIEEPIEQQTHFLTMPAIELDPSWVHH
jgi:hypothetical protein